MKVMRLSLSKKLYLDRDPFTGTEFFEVISKNAFDGCDMSDVVLNVDHEAHPSQELRPEIGFTS